MNDSDTSSEKPEMDVKRTESEESYMDKKESSLDGIDSEINSKVLTGWNLVGAFSGMLLSIWLIALDQTILAPALPLIASDFNSLDKIAWIASGYFLTQTSFLLFFGQVLTVFDRKLIFLLTIGLFEIGSLLCALAPNPTVLILGRAIAGVGASGILISVLAILAEVTTLEQRPKLLGLFGAIFAVSSVTGPILGGVFTSRLTWRWCFWINLPFGFISIVAIFFILGPSPAPPMEAAVETYTEDKIRRWSRGRLTLSPKSLFFKLAALDWTGALLILGLITSLLLALQYGGNEYPWSSPVVIGCFCAFGILSVVFILYEWKFTSGLGLLPLRLLQDRTQIGAMLSSFSVMFTLLGGTYFLPIFYQAKGGSPQESGINILPFMLGITGAAAIAGGIVSYWGRYKPLLVIGPIFICIGSGLLTTIDENTSNPKLIGYQLLTALGVGSVLQQVIIAVQADIKNINDLPQKTALVSFAQIIGGTIGISICSAVFNSKLESGLILYAPDAPFELVRNSVSAIFTLPLSQQAGVIHAYVKALDIVYGVSIAAGVLAILSGSLVRNISVKGKPMIPEMA